MTASNHLESRLEAYKGGQVRVIRYDDIQFQGLFDSIWIAAHPLKTYEGGLRVNFTWTAERDDTSNRWWSAKIPMYAPDQSCEFHFESAIEFGREYDRVRFTVLRTPEWGYILHPNDPDILKLEDVSNPYG